MKLSPSHNSLLMQMYAAVGDDTAWQALIEQLCAYFKASIGMLVVAGQGQRDQAFYAAHNHAENVARLF